MKVVLVDSCYLPVGVELPPHEANKYGWEQYLQLDQDDIAERCWRTDIVISLATKISNKALQKMIKVGLLIVTDEAANLLDKQAIAGMEIELVTLPDARFDNVTDATSSCKKISKLIDDYIRENQDKESK